MSEINIFRDQIKSHFAKMPEVVETYKLGKVEVTITETEKPNKLLVSCFDGEFKSEFTVSQYEFENYRRLMNQRISRAFSGESDED